MSFPLDPNNLEGQAPLEIGPLPAGQELGDTWTFFAVAPAESATPGQAYLVSADQLRLRLNPEDLYGPTPPIGANVVSPAGRKNQKYYHLKSTSYDLYQHNGTTWVLKLANATLSLTTPEGGVAQNAAPTVTLAAAVASLTLGGAVTLTANPFDSDGTISRVDFYEGSVLATTKLAAPWLFDAAPNSVGTKSYTAVAYDDKGLSRTSAPVKVEVYAASNQLPLAAVSLSASSAPANQSLTITVTASDPDGFVAKVQVFDSGKLLETFTTAPYSLTYATSVVGSHSIQAVVTDNQGGTRTSEAKTLTITAGSGNAAPTVSYSQSVNTVQVGQPVTLSASATDSDGVVTKVEFFQGGTKVGEAASSPYGYQFVPTTAGTYTMFAKATDNSGNTATTGGMTLTVTTTPVSNVTPTTPTFSGFSDTQEGGSVTLDIVAPYSLSDYRVSLPGTPTSFNTPTSATISVGNVAGPVRAYIAAATGRNQSQTAASTSFTTYTAPVNPTFNTTLNPEGYADVVTYSGATGTQFLFNAPLPFGDPSPAVMLVFLDGTQVGQVDFNAFPTGTPPQACAVRVNGTTYYTTFQNSDNVALA